MTGMNMLVGHDDDDERQPFGMISAFRSQNQQLCQDKSSKRYSIGTYDYQYCHHHPPPPPSPPHQRKTAKAAAA